LKASEAIRRFVVPGTGQSTFIGAAAAGAELDGAAEEVTAGTI
jgi:hypothetical protein